jgi:hypothetical protein
MILCAMSINAQSKLIGQWKTTDGKSIKFRSDNTFVHNVIDKEYEGTYNYKKNTNGSEILSMHYTMGSKEYRIKMMTSNLLVINDKTGNQELKLKKVENEVRSELLSNRNMAETKKENSLANERNDEVAENVEKSNGNFAQRITGPNPLLPKNSSIFRLSVGLFPDLTIREVKSNLALPPVIFQLEKQVYGNFGCSASLGYAKWKSSLELFNYDINYTQLNFGIRANYHVNPIEKLDINLSAGLTYRYMKAGLGGLGSLGRLGANGNKMTFAPVIGSTYHLRPNLGLNLEIGNDNLSWIKLGVAYKFL